MEIQGKHLREAREKYNLSARELCKLIGVSPGMVSSWETGAHPILPKWNEKLVQVFQKIGKEKWEKLQKRQRSNQQGTRNLLKAVAARKAKRNSTENFDGSLAATLQPSSAISENSQLDTGTNPKGNGSSFPPIKTQTSSSSKSSPGKPDSPLTSAEESEPRSPTLTPSSATALPTPSQNDSPIAPPASRISPPVTQLPEEIQGILRSATTEDFQFLRCLKDPSYWIFNFGRTWDPHDKINPVKLYPPKKHIRVLIDEWLSHLLMAVYKSRQMQCTWTFVGLYLWDTWAHRGRFNFFQSKKEEDANELVWRAWFIWNQLPEFLQRGVIVEGGQKYYVPLKCNPSNNGKPKYCLFELVDDKGVTWSKIVGIPQGPDQLRSYTASGILSDEMAFQDDAERSFVAAKPTIEGGGRYTAVSTAAPGFFSGIIHDRAS